MNKLYLNFLILLLLGNYLSLNYVYNSKTQDVTAICIVYIIREREFLRLNEPVYKIGMTTQELNSRLSGYSIYIVIYT